MIQETVQEIKNTITDSLGNVHTAFPAIINAVDTVNGMVTVTPSIKKKMPNGTTVNYPMISGIPIVFPQGGSASFVFPINVGDSCLIVVAEQSLEDWLYQRETDTDLAFDITNSICIPGLGRTAPANFAEACSNGAAIMACGPNKVSVSNSGITFTGNVTCNGYFQLNGGTNISTDD